MKRNGRADTTIAKAGVTAQKVRYLDLLLVEPWAVHLNRAVDVPVQAPFDVMAPTR